MTSTGQASDLRRALSASMFDIVAAAGLDRLTVREVAARAGVSIGAVQHYFPTKEAMLIAAFEETVRRIRTRIESLQLSADVPRNLRLVLRELLPLDDDRAAEIRVQLAFNTRAMTDSRLAAVQRATLSALHDGLSAGLRTIPGVTSRRARVMATALAATADGLALHAVSSGGLLSPSQLEQALHLAVDVVAGP